MFEARTEVVADDLACKSVGQDAFVFSGTTNRDDLLLQLQLITAYLTDPGYRPEALRIAQKNFDQLYTRFAHVPEGPLQLEVPRLLASGDPRFGLPTREEVFARTLDHSRVWLTPQFARGAIEIGVIGDLEPDAVIDVEKLGESGGSPVLARGRSPFALARRGAGGYVSLSPL